MTRNPHVAEPFRSIVNSLCPPVSGSSPLVSDVPMKGPAMSHPDNVLHFALRDMAKQQPVKIPASGANATDIAHVHAELSLVLTMAEGIVKDRMAILNSNLPITQPINLECFYEHLESAREELLGQLTRAANRME